MSQSFKDYEIVIVQEGKMAQNTNAGMKKAKGELIKILYLDDYLAHPDSLKVIAETIRPTDMWFATGCTHQRTNDVDYYEDPHSPHYPHYTEDVHLGNNQIGSPSVVTLRNEGRLLFDENLSFFLDCDLYKRYHEQYGAPRLSRDLNVVIGIGEHQTSTTMSDQEKLEEFNYMRNKYA